MLQVGDQVAGLLVATGRLGQPLSLCSRLLIARATNRDWSLRALVAGLLGSPYSPGQMTYDLRRLRLHGLIRRVEGRHRYVLTDDGLQFAVFHTKLGERVLPALFAAQQPNSPPQLRHALAVIGDCVNDGLADAGLAIAA